MALVSLFPRGVDDPLPLDVLADIATRAARRHARSNPEPVAPPGGRWHVRLRTTAHYDVWLLGWGVDSSVDMHDHGGSAGAIAVVRGTLFEHTPRPSGGFRRLSIAAGDLHAFEAGRVHDIRNEGPRPALSTHVYSPPLQTMTYFDEKVTPLRTELIDLPALVEDH